MRRLVLGPLLALAIVGSGCGSHMPSEGHPAIERQREEKQISNFCEEYTREEAAAQGKDALETYIVACES